jgi:hypothetical protein
MTDAVGVVQAYASGEQMLKHLAQSGRRGAHALFREIGRPERRHGVWFHGRQDAARVGLEVVCELVDHAVPERPKQLGVEGCIKGVFRLEPTDSLCRKHVTGRCK